MSRDRSTSSSSTAGDLYVDVLTMLEGRLAYRVVVVADRSPDDPDLVPYLERVRSPNGDFEVSVRASRAR